eukprot:GFUD01083805.1.p1 GENE.GFUD01083805.1~~GFUD01083805.1.p1  ORF type:complete len:294 (+),score=51.23 GFUD01083805.1:46-927(+)
MHWKYSLLIFSFAVAAQGEQDPSNRVKRQSCTCRPKSRCAWAVYRRSQTSGFVCDLEGGREGFCCPDIVARTSQRKTSLFSTRSFATFSPRHPTVSNNETQTTLSRVKNPERSFVQEDVVEDITQDDTDLLSTARKPQIAVRQENVVVNTTQEEIDLLSTTIVPDASRLPSVFTNRDIVLNVRQTETSFAKVDDETRGHRLNNKLKNEFKDLSDYARKILHTTIAPAESTSRLPSVVTNQDIKEILLNVRQSETSFAPVDVETQGHRLNNKAKTEFQDLRDYARKVLHMGLDN